MKKIAFIGAGPATLSCAQALLKNNDFKIRIYDKNIRSGGAMYTGIPSWRMSLAFVDRIEKELLEKKVEFFYQTEVGKDISWQKIRRSNDIIIVAIGAQIENLAGFEEGNGYEAGLTMLYNLNIFHQEEQYHQKYQHAIVWGGGNVAMDCCRSLKRIIPDVKIIYRRSELEMPASKKEINDAKKEGVEFLFLENIADIIRDEYGQVKGVQVDKMELTSEDSSGRRGVKVIPGSRHFISADLVVAAIGQKVNFQALSPRLNRISKECHQSTLKNVFIIGDALYGPSIIGKAVQDGKKCATDILQYLNKKKKITLKRKH